MNKPSKFLQSDYLDTAHGFQKPEGLKMASQIVICNHKPIVANHPHYRIAN